MRTDIIPDENGKGFTIASIGEDVELANPIEYYKKWTLQTNSVIYEKLLLLKDPTIPIDIVKKVSLKHAMEDWDERFKIITETYVPENLFKILGNVSKKEQERMLRGIQLTPFSLTAFAFKVFTEHGYSFSSYHSEHLPKSVDRKLMPVLSHIDEETKNIKKIGETSLTDGQIKQAIEQRKVIATKIFDKGSEWHAFFITYNSIAGKESWNNGQPHFHYISDKFQITREEAVKQFKSDHYPKTSVHIELLDYGEQPE